MKTRIKALLTWILAAVLRPGLIGRFHRGQLTILMYHGIVDRPLIIPDSCMVHVDAFRSQMRHLSRNFKVVSLTDAVRLIHENSIKEPTVVITFDDGYQNNFDLALPILEEESLPATIFLATLFVDSDTTIWTGLLQNAFSKSDLPNFEWREKTFQLATPEQRLASLKTVKSMLKDNPQDSLFDEVHSIVEMLGNGRSIALDDDSPYRMLDSKSLSQLVKSDLIDICAHTHSHYVLSRIPASTQKQEILQSLDIIEQHSGERCTTFAYPNGTKADYDRHCLEILREAGIDAAVTTEPGTCHADSPPLELERIAVDANADMSSFKLSVFDIVGRVKNKLQKRKTA